MTVTDKPLLSVIIPALNEARSIDTTLRTVFCLTMPVEVIVVDGGSEDNTGEIARGCGARVITSERGRGTQMHRGASAATGDVFWFLHADTAVPAESVNLIVAALLDEKVVAGNFNVRFDGPGAAPIFMNWLYPQLRRVGLNYGDSAIFVRREAYEQSGGFNAFPIFEDLDLLRRLKKIGNFALLPATVVTSARRFEGRSFMVTLMRWLALQLLYWLGVNPRRLAVLYAPVRQGREQIEQAGAE